jgi:hypothetical protein
VVLEATEQGGIDDSVTKHGTPAAEVPVLGRVSEVRLGKRERVVPAAESCAERSAD